MSIQCFKYFDQSLIKVEKTALDLGQTDRISLTHDIDIQSTASYSHDLLISKSSKLMVSWFQR